MSNQAIKQAGKYAAILMKNAPENGATEDGGEKAPPIEAVADFDADGVILIRGQFGPENIRRTKKAAAPYVSIAWPDSYPLRSGTATVYLASTFVDEIDD